MKRLLTLFASIFVAAGLVLSGGLYDVYAATPDYRVELNAVAKTEITPEKPEKLEKLAVVEQPVVTVVPTYVAAPVVSRDIGPDLSNHLEMPSIGVYRAVQTVGLNGVGEIDVPASNVGLWNGGAMPGQNGVVFLDGHVFGVFSNLKNTPVGSEFSLTWGGTVYRYRVANNQTYSIEYLQQTTNGVWAGILQTPTGGPRGLNIMTCAGQPQGNTYSHRTVVYAYQIS